MSIHILKNNELTLSIDEHGAELISITDNQTKTEYLWNADPIYWKRHSPILFPIVGSLKNQTYTYQNQTYTLPQHGFARDMDFTFLSNTSCSQSSNIDEREQTVCFQLQPTEETRSVYPFEFILEVNYQLIGRKITVMWNVINKDTKTMYFSIGAHPAFMCPLEESGKQSDYFISFDNESPIHYLLIDQQGLALSMPIHKEAILPTINGLLPITPTLFDQDALIIENNQCHSVSLVNFDKKPYLTVDFDAPLFGLWSPAKKNAPFICIEPWYGRCDGREFKGTLQEREWGNQLDVGKDFKASYTITIASVN